jgi:hypothetical protein
MKENKMDIDLYEMKAELAKRCGDDQLDWVAKHGAANTAYVVAVGEDGMPKELADALRAHGYEDGESAMVIVQLCNSFIQKGH